MQTRIERVDSERAKELMELNTSNFRPLNKSLVSKYANDMKRGKWQQNGEPLIFNGTELKNGQHRLAAVIKSGMEIEFLIVDGVSADGMTMDSGKSRTIQQWLMHHGIKSATTFASISRIAMAHESGRWAVGQIWGTRWPIDVHVDYCLQHRESLQDVTELVRNMRSGGVSQSMIGGIVYIGTNGRSGNLLRDSETGRWFIHAFRTGEDLVEGDPVLALRDQSSRANRGRAQWGRDYALGLTAMAWNKTITGEAVKMLSYKMSGPRRQPMQRVLMDDESGEQPVISKTKSWIQ